MNALEIQTHAQKLHAVLGPKALVEAADKVRQYEAAGNRQEADTWKRIQAALRDIKDPISS